jgi:ATP-dependent helicase/nuclease subunit B
MPESSALILQVVEALARGWLVVTANQRAARTLRHVFDLKQRTEGRLSWEPPSILAWENWLQSLHRRLVLEGKTTEVILNGSQQHALWRAIVRSDPTIDSLRPVDALAEAASGAWALLHAYRGRSRLGRYSGNSDTRVFARWASEFERRLKRGEYVTPPQLPERLIVALRRGEIETPPGLLLVGFDTQLPVQEALLAAFAASGTAVDSPAQESPASGMRLAVAKTEKEELLACAGWARTELERRPNAQLAVIVPSIEPLRAAIDRTFRLVLAPELNDVASPAAASPFEFSLGEPLTRNAMVGTALDVLRWSQGPLPLERISSLLLSPYFAMADASEHLARAEFDAFVRKQKILEPRLSLSALLRLGARWKGNAGIPGLMSHLTALRSAFGSPELPLLGTHNSWVETIGDILVAAGWAMAAQLDSVEFQTRRKWESALDELATLDFDTQPVPFAQAVESLERIAHQTLFAPESRHAAVQILGPFESAGSHFDAVWFLRANDAEWSTTASPNPLLPWQLQRDLNMPGTLPERDIELARSVTARIGASASTVMFSFARESTDGPQRSSPALRTLALEQVDAETFLAKENTEDSVVLEVITCEPAIEPPPDLVLQGGAGVLEKQAACAFRAFAEVRLFSSPLDRAVLGLDPGERGSIVHKVLQLFWLSVRSQAELKALSWEARNKTLDDCIHAALTEKTRAPDPGWAQAYLDAERQRLRNLLRPWLDYEAEIRSEFLVKDLESEHSDVTIGPLRLHVKVDRVDTWLHHGAPEGDVILDYKTGIANPAEWTGDRPDAPQLPLYAVVSGSLKLAGVAFASVRPGNKREIRGYESHKGVLPKTGRDAPPDLTAQVVEWRRVLTALAEDFHSGNAEVRPKNYPDTCRYCQQRLLCRLDVTTLSADETEDSDDLFFEEEYG